MMKKFSNLMVDLETLGTAPDSAVVQVGLWAFDPQEIASQGRRLDILPSKGFKCDFDTIQFWMKQSEEARLSVFGSTYGRSEEPHAIESIYWYISNYCSREFTVWGMPSAFDIPILETMLRRNNCPIPWAHWRVKCARTIFDYKGISKEKRVKPEIEHDGMFDAKAQAETMVKYELLLNK